MRGISLVLSFASGIDLHIERYALRSSWPVSVNRAGRGTEAEKKKGSLDWLFFMAILMMLVGGLENTTPVATTATCASVDYKTRVRNEIITNGEKRNILGCAFIFSCVETV